MVNLVYKNEVIFCGGSDEELYISHGKEKPAESSRRGMRNTG